jgi:predicted GNAT superfamily acetyltransferase
MNTETQIKNAVLWIEKLMTAEKDGVKQGRTILGDQEKGYCCIGYGCHVTQTFYDPSQALSSCFHGVVGLFDDCGNTLTNGYSCVAMNDARRFTFLQIAEQLTAAPFQYFHPDVAQGIKEHFA